MSRHVDFKTSHCSLCGGTHYGTGGPGLCPYRCGSCGVNTDHCEREDCQRNRRWKSEEGAAPGPSHSAVTESKGER